MASSISSSVSAGAGGGPTLLTLLTDSDKLQTTNWNEWKRTISSILHIKGLMGYADGTVRPPLKARPLPIPNTATPATPTPAAQVTSPTSNPFIAAMQQQDSAQSTGGAFGLTPVQGSSLPKPLPQLPIQHGDWDCSDAAAAAHITLNIKNQAILSKFRDGASAYEIWSSLCARFERANGILALQA